MANLFHIEVALAASADYISDSWVVEKFFSGSLQLVWTGLNSLTATAIVEVSNDNVNWDASGCSQGVTLTPASGNQIWEFRGFTSRYVRLNYAHNSVTTGSLVLRSYEQPREGAF